MTMVDRRTLLLGIGAGLAACAAAAPARAATPRAAKLIAAARAQLGVTLRYDPAYTALRFPMGDVPRAKGVCTDVLIRAYRDALGLDLQALVHADMKAAFAAYPRIWGLRRPDPSIDHRRVPNLRAWLSRKGAALPVPRDPAGWQPGDIFTSLISGRLPHIGIVSDRAGARGPMVIHNIGAGAREEDALGDWPVTGRYRWALG
ncbi:DUF1287 domain-containing protein [Sphingomonas canadensis]|uniref:DUF1287 domain-containing protein n=1 Tax=Sphingomonas canadensis TaxID=1219257 RepID=A0ABW3H9A0_9SPHN|nr:DUF1287 domain-containing protein [Sphingomonas canadensis]MCW3835941.1 DUF1287 domain-containing protein [Sphingomonas canadensis]